MPALTEEHERTGRVYVRLPEESVSELAGYIEASGVARSQFLALSIMIGGRALNQALHPQGLTPAIVDQITASVQQVVMSPEFVQAILAAEPDLVRAE